jgi:hypothetical protein
LVKAAARLFMVWAYMFAGMKVLSPLPPFPISRSKARTISLSTGINGSLSRAQVMVVHGDPVLFIPGKR